MLMKRLSGTHPLTYPERCPIYALRKSGYSIRAIAWELNRSHTTIARELRRNSGHRGYRHVQAERTARERRRASSSRPRKHIEKLTAALWVVIEGRLRRAWSPEPIAGRLRREGVVSVSPEWIDQHIRKDRRMGGHLWRSLRRRGKKPNVTAGRDSGRGCIPNRVDSAARPARVEAKTRVGDWEADTGDGQGAQRGSGDAQGSRGVDRMSKRVLIQRVTRKTAAAVGDAIRTMLAPDPVHTITADNGKEFAGHAAIATALEARFFFARPYASWERGLNEHTNGLIRGYYPKGTDFRAVTSEDVQRVQDALNARPRKVLGYRTPQEVMAAADA